MRLGAALRSRLDPGPTAVREDHLQSVLARLAEHKRAHLKRARKHPGVAEAGIRDIVGHWTIAAHGNVVARGARTADHRFACAYFAVLIFIDVQDPPDLPAAAVVDALLPVAAFAQVDPVAALDRLAARLIQYAGQKMGVVGELLRRDPMPIRRPGGCDPPPCGGT